MNQHQIILLPKENYTQWRAASLDYAIKFGVNLTADPDSAGKAIATDHTVTVVTSSNGIASYGLDIAQWFADNYPAVQLDMVRVDSPDELKTFFAPRVTSGDRFLQPQPPAAPEPTPAPQPQPAPTSPPAPESAAPNVVNGITGVLRLKENKPTYATRIENIFFYEEITNTTQQPISYSVIGVKVVKLTGDGSDFFHTSWSGNLLIGANCKGPTDSCGGGWNDSFRIEKPGTYRIYLSICFSPLHDALAGRGDWQTLTDGTDIATIDWTPPG